MLDKTRCFLLPSRHHYMAPLLPGNITYEPLFEGASCARPISCRAKGIPRSAGLRVPAQRRFRHPGSALLLVAPAPINH